MTTDRRPPRRRHPAVSARILALGLSSMATFGMIAGYSLAEARTIPDEPQPLVAPVTPTAGNPPAGAADAGVGGQASIPGGSTGPKPSSTKPSSTKPSTATKAPQSIQVPVPAVPAQGGGNTQNSSGSN